jgi:hypothetical protein
MERADAGADDQRVIWPAAALAVLLLGFVVLYGSALQARLAIDADGDSGDASADGDAVGAARAVDPRTSQAPAGNVLCGLPTGDSADTMALYRAPRQATASSLTASISSSLAPSERR